MFQDTFLRQSNADNQTKMFLSRLLFRSYLQQTLILWMKGEPLCSCGLDVFQVVTVSKMVVFLFEVFIFSWPPQHFLIVVSSHSALCFFSVDIRLCLLYSASCNSRLAFFLTKQTNKQGYFSPTLLCKSVFLAA